MKASRHWHCHCGCGENIEPGEHFNIQRGGIFLKHGHPKKERKKCTQKKR
jgi:hypothetical protein